MSLIFNASTVCFYLFGVFLFTQQRHINNFRGASQVFYTVLVWNCFAAFIAAIAYLIFYGVHLSSWWAPFAILLIDTLLGASLQAFVSRIIPEWILSILGFFCMPILGFLMFYLL
jgi:hypothetical protein